MIRRVCLFTGSSRGAKADYAAAATAFGGLLATRGIGLVFGGGSIGLMGLAADAALAAGGEVIGVIPRALATAEIAHRGLSELRVVASMHERKATMASLADAFVALPGGFGTLEELFEVVTWTQLGLHAKPVGLLDVAGYFGPLRAFLAHMVAERFVRAEHRALVIEGDAPDALLDALVAWRSPVGIGKFITADET